MHNHSAWIIFMAWICLQAALFAWRFWLFQTAPSYAPVRKVVDIGLPMAKAFALLINLNAALLPLCMLRLPSTWLNSFHLTRCWLPLDRQVAAHRWIVGGLLFSAVAHSVAHFYNYARIPGGWLRLAFAKGAGITGNLMLLCMLCICVTACFRRQCFECFWYLHQVAIWIIYGLLGVHGAFCTIRDGHGHCSEVTSYRWIAVPMLLYALELVIREVRSYKSVQIHRAILHQAGVLELQFLTSLHYTPGQYVLLCCPAVSRWQWHPFTITSAPHEAVLKVHIRPAGNWTKALVASLGIKLNPTAILGDFSCLKIRLDGPWGAPAQSWLDYPIVLCIGAGIGQTPFASILKHLTASAVSERVIFYGICRDTQVKISLSLVV